MDKYVSPYIGRPLSIFERDYDTPLPEDLGVSFSSPGRGFFFRSESVTAKYVCLYWDFRARMKKFGPMIFQMCLRPVDMCPSQGTFFQILRKPRN